MSSNIAVVGVDKVSTGLILDGSTKVFLSGKNVAVVGSHVADHGSHTNVTMTQGSATVYVEGKKLCRKGDLASCGDTIASGSAVGFSN